jgi:hypothetical protein
MREGTRRDSVKKRTSSEPMTGRTAATVLATAPNVLPRGAGVL